MFGKHFTAFTSELDFRRVFGAQFFFSTKWKRRLWTGLFMTTVCPKPQAKFPALQIGGLAPPAFPKRSSFYGSVHTGTPCQPPAPRPPPLSLRPREDKPMMVSPSQEPVLTKVQQRSLVLPTTLPPDICRESRGNFTTSLQHWNASKQAYEAWLSDLIRAIGPSSWICREFSSQKTFPTVIRQLLCHIGPSTLDLYSRAIATTWNWMKHLGIDWQDLNLQFLVEILHLAKDAAKNDVQANRLQPQYILRGLRWLTKTALVEHLEPILNNALISSFVKGSGAPKDRREAMPLPLLILILWEDALKSSVTPTWVKAPRWRLSAGYLGVPQVCRFATHWALLTQPGGQLSSWHVSNDQDDSLRTTVRGFAGWFHGRRGDKFLGFSLAASSTSGNGKNFHTLSLTSSFPRWTVCIAQRFPAHCLTQRLFGRLGGPAKHLGIVLVCHQVRPRISLFILSRFQCCQWRRNFGCHTKIVKFKVITQVAPCNYTVGTIQ